MPLLAPSIHYQPCKKQLNIKLIFYSLKHPINQSASRINLSKSIFNKREKKKHIVLKRNTTFKALKRISHRIMIISVSLVGRLIALICHFYNSKHPVLHALKCFNSHAIFIYLAELTLTCTLHWPNVHNKLKRKRKVGNGREKEN